MAGATPKHDYEARYQQLKAAGAPGWAGNGQARNPLRLAETIDGLMRRGVRPTPPAQALELGCGNGAACFHLARRGYEVVGIDTSATAIAWAKERFSEADLAAAFAVGNVCDIHALFDDELFDLVFDGACLQCLMGRDRTLCLTEVRRILRPKGSFIVSSMCGVPKSLDGPLRYDPGHAVLRADGQAYRTIRQLLDLLVEISDVGFGIEDAAIRENTWWDHATVVCRRLS